MVDAACASADLARSVAMHSVVTIGRKTARHLSAGRTSGLGAFLTMSAVRHLPRRTLERLIFISLMSATALRSGARSPAQGHGSTTVPTGVLRFARHVLWAGRSEASSPFALQTPFRGRQALRKKFSEPLARPLQGFEMAVARARMPVQSRCTVEAGTRREPMQGGIRPVGETRIASHFGAKMVQASPP
ncbi:MAG: hypothetical protein CMJ18_15490 [Phycisphaeraceae bacterium]|nr:hypothetical protein [Phycisphaeraceae bacterium]